jgi:hypothetical protein
LSPIDWTASTTTTENLPPFHTRCRQKYKIKINKIKTITKLAEVSEEEKIRTKSGLFLLLHSPSSFQIHYSRLNHAAAAAAAVISLSQQQHNFT